MRIPICILSAILLCISPVLYGQDAMIREIQDDSSLRASLVDTWFIERSSLVMDRQSVLKELPGGNPVELRIEQGREEFLVILARERKGTFPAWSQGSWILYRRKTDGEPVKIRCFLRSDPYTYIQFRPLDAEQSLLDVVVYNGYLLYGLPIPFSFKRLYTLPVREVISALGEQFPRSYFDVHGDAYRDLRSFVEALRTALSTLSYKEDGAFNEEGEPVYIETSLPQEGTPGVNCSGFAKWVIDGLLRPITGERLQIQPLKEILSPRGSSFSYPYESLRDPYFGLDWTRNLALAAHRVLRSTESGSLEELEVRSSPISNLIIRRDMESTLRSYPGYMVNAGFGMEGLLPLLYTLAVDNPACFYLASVNGEFGDKPRLHQHFHIAVLVPLFSEDGVFMPLVFESATEISFQSFVERYPGHHINLVRIPVVATFSP